MNSREPFDLAPERASDWSENLHAVYHRAKNYLKRYWWVLILTTGLSISHQTYKEMQKEPVYTSRAQMKVAPKWELLKGEAYRESYMNFFGTQIHVMKGQGVRQRADAIMAAQYSHLVKSPVHYSVTKQHNTSIFLLTATGPNKEYTQHYLDAVMDAYQQIRLQEKQSAGRTAKLIAFEKIDELEDQLEADEQEIMSFRMNHNIVNMADQANVANSRLNNHNEALSKLRHHELTLTNLAIDQQIQGTEEESFVSFELQNLNQAYRTERSSLDNLLAERDEFAIYLKAKHPKMIYYESEIERSTRRLEILREQALQQLNRELLALRTKIRNQEVLVGEANSEAQHYNQLNTHYDQLIDRRDRNKAKYDSLQRQTEDIDLSVDLDQPMVTVFESAGVAYSEPINHMNGVIKGTSIGLAVGAICIFLLGSFDRRVISTEDLKQNFSEPILGIIPKEKSVDANSGILKDRDARHIFAEAFRTLRSSLLFMEQMDPKPNTFIITSAVPEEGKSTIASNLAISLAYANSRTLLVDADLRRGRLNRLFGLPNRDGLIEVLQGKLEFDDAIIDSEIENLHFLPRGESTAKTGELLLSDRMEQVIKTAKNTYDYVIFDAAPVLATDDTTSFASKADSILYVVRSTTIRVRQVRVSLDSLKMRGANILGFIMNFADTKGMDYYYYNKYQYYYRYQSSNEQAS